MNIGANIKNVYFIGIGGVHMSGLAQLLAGCGYNVSGSDKAASYVTDRLANAGIAVHIGHNAANITKNLDLVVYTAAVKPNNPEFMAANDLDILVYERAKLLGLVMKNYKTAVCVSGVHGKTTVTSMISEIFMEAGVNPAIMNGGVLPSINSAWKSGDDKYFIAEACEYYDGFLKLFPTIGVILNIELDHTDYFSSLMAMRRSFSSFANLIPKNGTLIINGEIEGVSAITDGLKCRVITFGNEGCDWQAANVTYNGAGRGSFDAVEHGKTIGRVELGLIGYHNILNALAALACARAANLPFEAAVGALANFTGAARRFEYKGKFNGAQIYDDYAHHPTEVAATLAAIKNSEFSKLYAVFQPHTHTRTKELLNDFAAAFGDADTVVLLDIYTPAGRSENEADIHSKHLAEKIADLGKDVRYFPDFESARKFLAETCKKNDMVVTMGAGDVYKLGELLVAN